MKPRFILDENIVILAQQALDEYGNPNVDFAELIRQIIDICHTLVVDDVLWDKYIEQLYNPRYHPPHTAPFLIRLLSDALTVPEKVEGLGHTAPAFDDEGSIPDGSRDDTFLVRLAVETRAMLVTADGALRDDLESCGILSKYGLTVVSQEDALRFL